MRSFSKPYKFSIIVGFPNKLKNKPDKNKS